MDQYEQRRLHQEKWKRWNEEREKEKFEKKMNIEENMENYAVNLAKKIREPNLDVKMTKEVKNELSSNICSICLELMIPPNHQPMLLFPCGHNLCRSCLFEDVPKGYSKKEPKRQHTSCPLCRQVIISHVLNRNLMNLICIYSDNRNLIEKELEQPEGNQEADKESEAVKLHVRCEILGQENAKLEKQLNELKHKRDVMTEVVETLKREKKRNQKQMEKLEEQAKLIHKHLCDKQEQLDRSDRLIKTVDDKKRLVEKTLLPLLQAKQKAEILEMARICYGQDKKK